VAGNTSSNNIAYQPIVVGKYEGRTTGIKIPNVS